MVLSGGYIQPPRQGEKLIGHKPTHALCARTRSSPALRVRTKALPAHKRRVKQKAQGPETILQHAKESRQG